MGTVLKISEAASLALHSMLLLAANGSLSLSVRKIAGTLHVSEAHLSKVLQRLAKQGLVQSTRGPRGGFVLRKRGSEISLLEIYEAIEGEITTEECVLGKRICNGSGCIFGGFLETVSEQMRDYLGRTRLSDMTHLI